MVKIGIIGYGRMGKTIEKIALERGNEIGFASDVTPTKEDLEKVDVCIEFSMPDAAVNNLKSCINQGVPVICGTTGWLDHFDEVTNLAKSKNSGFLYASNFSLGVNLFFEFNKKLAQIIGNNSEYSCEMEEIHHTKKLDEPSGTAISLANDIIDQTAYEKWQLGATKNSALGIKAIREADVPGTHIVKYTSSVDQITISHEAFSRQGFALGAVIAAEWIKGKQGVFSMKDVLNLDN